MKAKIIIEVKINVVEGKQMLMSEKGEGRECEVFHFA
jgi:hypothetical protein